MYMTQVIDPIMDELRPIRTELSRRYLSQTPEENRRDTEEALKRAQAASTKPLVFADPSKPRAFLN